jgi:hypothetical protein
MSKVRFLAVWLLALLAVLPLLAACGTMSVEPPAAAPTVTNVYPALTYTAAVEKVAAEGIWVAVTDAVSGRLVSFKAGESDFETLVTRLEEAVLTRSVPRYRQSAGDPVEVTVPYAVAFTLEFALGDGSVLIFDYGTGQFWFNARDAIYSASTDLDFYDLLARLYAQQD